MMNPTPKNRAHWEKESASYQAAHGAFLEERPCAWGCWRIPEAELRVLGETRDRDVLEFGCGGAQWALALASNGARAVGVDFSKAQLVHGQGSARERALPISLVAGNGERLPFCDASFDIVFCDHGVMSFARPERALAEASRVLRRGGLFAFCMSTPIRDIAYDEGSDRITRSFQRSYFALDHDEDEEIIDFQRPYGEWIRLFRANRFVIEGLVELRPPTAALTTYDDFAPLEWARDFPAEHIWKLSRE